MRNKYYQCVIARLDGDRIGDAVYGEAILELVRQGLGGFILAGGVREEIKAFLVKARALADEPLFIASFMDRGVGACVKDATLFPGPLAFAAALGDKGSPNLLFIRQALTAMAAEAADCGITTPLIPDFTYDRDQGGPVTGDIMERLTAEYEKAFRDMGITPWREHISPSGESRYYPVRSESKKSDGLSILNGLNNMAPRLADSISRGADLFMVSHDPESLIEEFVHDLPAYGFTEERMDALFARIASTRAQMSSGCLPAGTRADYTGNERLAREIARRAITLVKGRGRFLPVRDSDNLPLIYGGDEEHFLSSPLRFYVKQASHEKKPLPTHERPVLFLLFGKDGKGTRAETETGQDDPLERIMRGISPSIVVSFGNPHELERFAGASILIAAYDSSAQAQEAAFNCIIGERHFEGSMPLELALPVKEKRTKQP